MPKICSSFFLLLFFITTIQAQNSSRVPGEHARQEDLQPWEPQDIKKKALKFTPKILNPSRLGKRVGLKLIALYQRSIGPSSISRCPFHLSCSRFAAKAIQKHGFIFGLCMFIDRNLYRENPQIYYNYNFVYVSYGVIKLDDRIMVIGEN